MTVYCRYERHSAAAAAARLAPRLVWCPTRSTPAVRRVSGLRSALILQDRLDERSSVLFGHGAQKVGLLEWRGTPGAG